ncbi:hypothetical protein BOTNAR_0393g00010 [Botryotinia narcissicola]|uniref:Uncharacterized protein n=1 Tax=Botryotinia narcissicola TaxID=278944 RepID=A0A4Z1HNH5_9HELO|nr:hypothetical protein BOTNAR_0393g00010 [Botryotinia narcissicola]
MYKVLVIDNYIAVSSILELLGTYIYEQARVFAKRYKGINIGEEGEGGEEEQEQDEEEEE